MSGDMEKEDRTDIMRRLQDGRLGMVVSTEMAARGIDVPMLTHVINYDLPTDAEHYVHRAGRCGRAGRPGIVVNMVLPDTKFVLSKFTGKLGLTISDAEVKDAKLWAIKRTVAETLE
jgi:ATP-dependent RNA helicase DeaD